MRRALIVIAALAVCGCESTGYGGSRGEWSTYRNYDYNHPDASGRYDASRYYREDRSYGERQLSPNDRIYRGSNGQYYCRRSDGTTGLIVGAIAGGALGNALAPGGSETLGTILGAGAGAVIGQEVERGNARCR
jgi:hypothetical protein